MPSNRCVLYCVACKQWGGGGGWAWHRHTIQWVPFNPASNALLLTAWLQESVPLVQAGTMPTNRCEVSCW
jgi:hypothetical protein